MSCSLTKMFSKTVFLGVVVLVAASSGISAFASTSSGIDTPTGATVLPFAVEGVEGMDLVIQNSPNGPVYLGIGSSSPKAPLDVSGGMRAGGSTVVAGDACLPEGMRWL